MSSPPPDTATRDRMCTEHEHAAALLGVTCTGPETWGWEGRTLGRRAGGTWLRLLSVDTGKEGGKLWEGTAAAERLIPAGIPRPRLAAMRDWASDGHTYRAELTAYVTQPVLQTGGPVLDREPELSRTWWSDLRRTLHQVAAVPTDREAVRQEWIVRSFPRFLGIPAPTVIEWVTAHGDLHWGNLTGEPLAVLDWETWGRAPYGYDIGLLHTYALAQSATSARIRSEFADVLTSRAGRIGELVALAELLQVAERGGHPELAPLLAERAEQLTGCTLPALGGPST
ncbi:phosphotransferase [Streptomyces sp. NPDC058045]|uniref:phosphotransferase n=1 Tax=Streptomyces sp. NPDC058045 TaxID=3346311 RepID=UPI0036DFFCDF